MHTSVSSNFQAAFVTAVAVVVLATTPSPAAAQATLPPPAFHHLHLNTVDPDAAIAFYTRQFPSTAKAAWGGIAALKSPNNVMVLFNKVAGRQAAGEHARSPL
jgi:hypothetical protein